MRAKLDTSRVFERMFEIYGDQFTLLVPAGLILFVPLSLLIAVLLAAGGTLAVLLTVVVATIASFLYQGMVVEAVHDIVDGRRDHTVGSLYSSVTPLLGPLAVACVLLGLGVGIGLVLLIVPGLILLTIWAVVIPVVVIERADAVEAFGRSRALVRGNGWRVFGVIVVVVLLWFVLSGLVNALVGGATDESWVGYWVADLVIRVLIAPLGALAATVLYLELRRLGGEPLPEERAAPAR